MKIIDLSDRSQIDLVVHKCYDLLLWHIFEEEHPFDDKIIPDQSTRYFHNFLSENYEIQLKVIIYGDFRAILRYQKKIFQRAIVQYKQEIIIVYSEYGYTYGLFESLNNYDKNKINEAMSLLSECGLNIKQSKYSTVNSF